MSSLTPRERIRFKKGMRRNKTAGPGPLPFVVVMDNLGRDFNIGKIIRSADAFGAREVHLIGRTEFGPNAAMGSLKHVPIKMHQDFAQCFKALRESGFEVFVLDMEGKEDLAALKFPKKCAFIVGNERTGFSFDPKDYPELRTLRIPQYGRVASLNVAVAASIVMFEYARSTTAPVRNF